MKHQDLSQIQSSDHVIKLSKWFERFAEQSQDSKMYSTLAQMLSQDHVFLAKIPDNNFQPVPNLFLASVNYLLYKYPDDELTHFYPNHSIQSASGEFFLKFKHFCIDHNDEIVELMNSRLVQTNEVRRCALLLPALAEAASCKTTPVYLIDVGTSSGLNLLMDRYRIQYSDGVVLGTVDSAVELKCKLIGEQIPHNSLPIIVQRIGIDLNPIDLSSKDEFLWALSLIWPDQLDRIDRLRKAAEVLQKNPVTLKKGSALEQLFAVIKSIPINGHICVMHSFTLNQFTEHERSQLEEILKQASNHYQISRISLEWLNSKNPELVLESYMSGEKKAHRKLAECHQHGEWINWFAGCN